MPVFKSLQVEFQWNKQDTLNQTRFIFSCTKNLYIYSVLQSDTTFFSSSDLSKLHFLLTDGTSGLQIASKMYAG